MTAAGYRCADAADAAGDPLVASAPPARQWLLIEHGGPWHRHALSGAGLDPAVTTSLAAWTSDHASRVVLIRRPGSRPRAAAAEPARWCHVDAREGREHVRWGTIRHDSDLLHALLDPHAGTPSAEPVYLVCAHGRHDQCCAIRGRPVAAALAAAHPERTWECSHVGGDRFAANLVVLPHGLCYGHVSPAAALDVAAAHDAGLVTTALLRGRSSVPAPAQAAQHHARTTTGDDRVDAFAVLDVHADGHGAWRVRLDGVPPLLVRARAVAAGRRLTCRAGGPGVYVAHDVVDSRSPEPAHEEA